MQFLLTTTPKPMARFIRYVIGEDASHFALYFDEHDIVIHGTFPWVKIEYYQKWLKDQVIVRRLEYIGPMGHDQKREIYRQTLNHYLGRWYDVGALAFGLMAYPFRRFKKIIKRNLWASRKAVMCVELAEAVKKLMILPDVDWPDRFDKITPDQLGDMIASSRHVREEGA